MTLTGNFPLSSERQGGEEDLVDEAGELSGEESSELEANDAERAWEMCIGLTLPLKLGRREAEEVNRVGGAGELAGEESSLSLSDWWKVVSTEGMGRREAEVNRVGRAGELAGEESSLSLSDWWKMVSTEGMGRLEG